MNHPELPQNNTSKTLESLLNTKYQNQYKKELNEGVNSSFLEKMNQNKQKAYNDKIRALYDKCGLFYRKEHNSLFQGKSRMYGIYPNSTQQNKRENIKLNEVSQEQIEPRLKMEFA